MEISHVLVMEGLVDRYGDQGALHLHIERHSCMCCVVPAPRENAN